MTTIAPGSHRGSRVPIVSAPSPRLPGRSPQTRRRTSTCTPARGLAPETPGAMTSASPQPGALEPARWSWARARAFCRLSRGRFKTPETSSPVGLARAIPRGFGTRYALGWVVSAPRASQRTLCTGGRALGESGPALESEGAKRATQFDEEPRDLRRGDRTDHSLRILSDDETFTVRFP